MYRHFNNQNINLQNMNNLNGEDNEIIDLLSNFNEIKESVNSIEEFLDKIEAIYEGNTPLIICRIVDHTLNDSSLSLSALFIRVSVNYCVVYKNKFIDVIEPLNKILTKISNRMQTFREETIKCRENIARCYEDVNDFTNAALTLSASLTEENQRLMNAEDKLGLNLKIADFYLRVYSVKEAEPFINRACQLLTEVNKDIFYVTYKRLYAEMLDMKSRFLEASQRFMELSLNSSIKENKTKEHYLLRATISAILTPASPSRFKLLSTLCKDDRCKCLPTFAVLEKMSLNRLIYEQDMAAILDLLLPFQRKETLLKKVMVESNIVSLSQVYLSISLQSASRYLMIPPNQTEKFISEMISEDRLEGTIDQMSSFVRFPKHRNMASCDNKIEWICHSINSLVEKIETAHPEMCFSNREMQ